MLYSISQDNIAKIENILKTRALDYVFLVDYAAHIETFLKFLSEQSPGTIKVFCHTEKEPHPIAEATDWRISRKPWPLADYMKFLSEDRIDFKGHTPVYDKDVSRLNGWRGQYMRGPLNRISQAIHARIPNKMITTATDFILGLCGMTLQALIPPLRKKRGTVTFRYRNIDAHVLFDDSPGRDHYGENPLLERKLSAFEKEILTLPPDKTGFFIAAGPRHEYMKTVFDLEDSGKLNNYVLLVSGLYRPRAYKTTERRETGSFSKGNNVSIAGKAVYSDHCLAIGAGEKELWCYLSADNVDLQKQ